MRFFQIKVLRLSVLSNTSGRRTHIMVNAYRHILPPRHLLLNKASCQTSTPRINNCTTLLPLHRRMQTHVLATRQAQSTEVFYIAQLLCSIFHEIFQLVQSFLNLRLRTCSVSELREIVRGGGRTWAVNQLPMLRIIHLVCHDQGQERYCLSCPGRHFEDTVTAGIESLCQILAHFSDQTREASYSLDLACTYARKFISIISAVYIKNNIRILFYDDN